MCGIAGYLTTKEVDSPSTVMAMVLQLTHRGPDDSGSWVDASCGIALAHQRLSILDLSPAGHQPMSSSCGRYVIVFNGEIYNHLQLRAELHGRGSSEGFSGHSDTETILACITAWGFQRTLTAIKGMFALAIWDKLECALFLARDRMGEKPLYYGWQGASFLFGSELKSLKAHSDFQGAIDRGALSLFLRHNYVPGPYSIYQEIFKLPPGTWLRISLKSREAQPQAYWSVAQVAKYGEQNRFDGTDAEALDLLEDRLIESVHGQMLSDVPFGALLSGGIDSSTICALMQANSSQAIKTFTIGFGEEKYDEGVHAREVAKHLGTDHTELHLGANDALSLVPLMPSMYDEPFADSSQLPTHLVMKLAREHVSVALSGDGGDELFCGYKRYFHVEKLWNRMKYLPPAVRKGIGSCFLGLSSDKLGRLGYRLKNIGSSDELFKSYLTEWADPCLVVIDGYIPDYLLSEKNQWPGLSDAKERMMAVDSLLYLPGDIMVKVDRAAMAVSLETRAPFLDQNLLEFVWKLPMNFKYRNGEGKWLLRQLLYRYVPKELVDRPKMGFGIPLDSWLRGPLREWAEDLLAEDRLVREGFFRAGPIRSAWDLHQQGKANNGYRLWSILMFQAWLEAQ